MLPGKAYSVEDALQILRRRYWLLIVPLAVAGALAAAYSKRLPNIYRSETLIQVMPQRIPTNYVQSTVTEPIEDRLRSLATTILSRSRLERIVYQFDLYRDERKSMNMEDIVRVMRDRDVVVDPVRGDSFRVVYSGRDPVQVMNVADSLAELFIEETLRDRQTLAESTSQFLERELADAKAKLIDHERRLEAWRMKYAGELPTELQGNLQQIQGTQMALRDIRDSINTDRQRRLELERQSGDVQALLAADASTSFSLPPAAPGAPAAASGSTAQQLAAAQGALASLEQQGKKPGHPDIDMAQRRVRDLQARLRAEAALPVAPATPGAPVDTSRPRRVADLRLQMDEIDRQIAVKREEERRLQLLATDLQRRVDAIPTRESEFTELTRDYNILRGSYEGLLGNQTQSRIAANLEKRQVGEQFKRLDPARLPEAPISPDRRRLTMMGMAAGLALGVVLVGFLTYRDLGFRTDKDVAALLQLPVLAVVPLMRSDNEARNDTWKRLAIGTGLGGLVVGCLVFVLRVVG